ncbi:MAG: DUF6263 family protein [Ferruginibacter sp.]
MGIQKKYWTLLVGFICFIAGCKSGTKAGTRGHSSATDKDGHESYQFQLKLATGAKYNCNINSETITNIVVNDKEVISTNKSTFGLQYEVLYSSPDSIVLKATYQTFHIVIKSGDEEKVTDADNAAESQDPMEKLLSNIKGSSLIITMNNKGKVKAVTGSDAITEKVLAGLSLFDEASKQKVKAQLTKLIGNDFIKNNIESGFNFYPDSAVIAGNSWQAKITQPGEINLIANTTYTLNSLDEGIATVAVTSKVSTGNNKAIIINQQVNADIKGETNGSSEADMASGMLIFSKTTSQMEGTIQIMAKEIPITISTKKQINIKRL